MLSYIYLASPYSSSHEDVRQQRHDAVENLTAQLLSQGFHVFSPIVHCHPMALKYDLPKDIDFWHRYDRMMLSKASMLLVLRLPGWEDSKGVAFEIAVAKELSIPVMFIDQC